MQKEFNDSLTENKRLLTTEKGKMYGIYVLDGFTGEVIELLDESIFDNWYDHCINPKHFKELAKKHNCEYTLETFHKITEHYNRNYLNIDTLLETSLDGKRIEISFYDEHDNLYVEKEDGEELEFSSLYKLNEWLVENELKPFPAFDLPEGKEDSWFSLNNKILPNDGYRAFCSYSVEHAEFTVIGVHYIDKLIVTVDFEKYWNDFELINAMDTLYQIHGIEVDNIFDLTCLNVNEVSLRSRDYRMQLGEKTLEQENYKEFATIIELVQDIKESYYVDISKQIEELLKGRYAF